MAEVDRTQQLLEALRGRKFVETQLFGVPVKLRVMEPMEAAAHIANMNKRAQEARQQVEERPTDPNEVVDQVVIEMMAQVIAGAIVEPALTDEQRAEVVNQLKTLPIADIGRAMDVMNLVVGGQAGIGAGETEVEAFFRESQSDV
jgi:hypothetical protein